MAIEALARCVSYAPAMISRYRLAEVAALMGDPARAAMLTTLWDGRARSAGDLARLAGISPATASSHLARLVAGGVLRVEPRGRHRYYRLAGVAVGEALEALARLAAPRSGTPATAPRDAALRSCRMCYDHLAGELGVAIADALVSHRAIALEHGAFALGRAGPAVFRRLGVEVEALLGGRRPLTRACLDWTERREHLGGALGAALAAQLLERDWVRRVRESRALLVTSTGRKGLLRSLAIRIH